eukprot:15447647-Alexandrium_andersonii.AAC.1
MPVGAGLRAHACPCPLDGPGQLGRIRCSPSLFAAACRVPGHASAFSARRTLLGLAMARVAARE